MAYQPLNRFCDQVSGFILVFVTMTMISPTVLAVKSADLVTDIPTVCLTDCHNSANGTITAVFCEEHPELTMKGRCCFNITEQKQPKVLGIDLHDCSMTEKVFASAVKDLSDLLYISLEKNPMQQVLDTDFNTNNGIVYLSLPYGVPCPGSDGAWRAEEVFNNMTICRDELDTCVYNNVSCPVNSHCVNSGIGRTECLCNDGYHGYKCMNKGTFPVLVFSLGICIPTVVICVLLWFTQRRYVKNDSKMN